MAAKAKKLGDFNRDVLRGWMDEHDLNTTQVGAAVGATANTVGTWLWGQYEPRGEKFRALVNYLTDLTGLRPGDVVEKLYSA